MFLTFKLKFKNITIHHLKSWTAEIVFIAIAVLFASIGLKAFLLPNGFLDGGVTGIAILLDKIWRIDISWSLLIISIPFLILGALSLSHRVLIKSIFSIIGLSLALYFENFEPITDDKLIIATFGGLFLGVGIGLAIRNGAVLDGSEILGIYVHNRFGISIGSTILVFNLVLFGITAIILSPEIAMYSILTYIVTGKAIDFTIQGFENYVGIMIVSEKSVDIQLSLIDSMGHGITVYQGRKGYGKSGTNEHRQIIHIIVNRIQVHRIHRLVENIDRHAFVVEFDVNSVSGGKIRKYLT